MCQSNSANMNSMINPTDLITSYLSKGNCARPISTSLFNCISVSALEGESHYRSLPPPVVGTDFRAVSTDFRAVFDLRSLRGCFPPVQGRRRR